MFVRNNRSLPRLLAAILFSALTATAVAHQVESTQPVTVNATPVTVAGTVTELTVKNQLTGETLRYFGLKLDQGGSYALTGTGLDLLSNGARINATGTLAGNIFNISLFSVVAQAQNLGRATALTESRKSLSGTLAVFHKDFLEEGRGEYGLAIRDGSDKPTQLNVAAIPDSLAIGMVINADGKVAADGGSLDVSTITILAPPAAKAGDIAAATVTNNVLVLPIKFTNTAGEPFSVAAINTEFQTKVAPYYQEVSYGQQLLNVTVANSNGSWLQAGVPTPACDYTAIGNLADAAATAAGYNINSYQNRYYVMPSIGCGWAGLAYVGWGRAWSNGYNALWVYGHELGHNFGLWHAGSISCGTQVLGGSCSVAEYGDPFDVMGNIRQMHFNAMQKAALNWIPSTSVKTHSSGTQTYQLSPLESGGQSTYAIKIPTSNVKRTYWVEFRQPIGFDSPLSNLPNLGAQIRVGGPQFDFPCGNCGGDDTEILDLTPGTGGGHDDAALLQGQTYVDSTTGVSISVLSATPGPTGVLTVSVAMGGKSSTATTLSSSGSPSLVGTSVTFTATVAGSAPTGTVTFTDGGAPICSAVALPAGAGNSKVATCSTSSLSVGTHSIVATYAGDASNNGSTSTTLSQVVNNRTTTSTTLASSGTPSSVGTNVIFTATVNGSAPTGTVAFTDGSSAISGCGTVGLPAGSANSKTATCSTSSLSVGTHSIVATYSGDASSLGSANTPLMQIVSPNPTGSTNVALASNGGVASASSQLSAAYPVTAINNGDAAGLNWGNGGGWADATGGGFPDWVQIDFSGSKTIDRVVVYSVQDNYSSPASPTDTMTFSLYGVTDFTVQGWNGTAWITLGTVSGNNLVKRTVNFTAYTTSKIRINITNALSGYSRLTEVEAWAGTTGPPPQGNVALASNGGVASASSQLSAAYPVTAINNDDAAGLNWGNGGGWADATGGGFPDWVQIDFSGSKTIDRVVVYSVQDNYSSPAPPTDTMTFSLYGVTDFTVQGWNGTAWITLGTVSGNNLVKRTVNFTAYTTSKIRINITNALSGYSRLTEVEAWAGTTGPPPQGNVALASNGGVASASSQLSAAYPVTAINNDDAAGLNWGNGGGWADATGGGFPDWVQIDFSGSKTIDRVVVYTVQDNYIGPAPPTDTMTFSLYGVTDFTVQGWNGTAWITLATVSGNNLVKRTVNFTAYTTSKIRINITNALSGYSRITEVEAWAGTAGPPAQSNVALASNGGVASASSQFSAAYSVAAVNNGEAAGLSWGNGGGWNDTTGGGFPDWVQIDFSGSKTIDRVVVYTVQDNYVSPAPPTDTMTFSLYGVTDFSVQGWNGTAWITLATVSGNNLVKRTVNFTAYTTSKIRINITGALGTYSRITEIEAWGNDPSTASR